jgi:hypothetical protein
VDQLEEQNGVPVLLGAGDGGGKEPRAVGRGDPADGRRAVGAVTVYPDGSARGGDDGLDIKDGIKGLGFASELFLTGRGFRARLSTAR